MRLEEMLRRSANRSPDAPAAFEPAGRRIGYRELDRYSDEIARQLAQSGVHASDRVGICSPKSIAAFASVFGAMKAGGAYVPVDYSAPAARNGGIFSDCETRAVIASRELTEPLVAHLTHGGRWKVDDLAGDPAFSTGHSVLRQADARATNLTPASDEAALSYILYTSGSTGKPKGVMHSHQTARAFIDWCSTKLAPTPNDVFSSHAPFHFDLSILDIYVPIKHAASVVLLDSTTGKQPQSIADAIERFGVSVWYSTPTILRMLTDAKIVDAQRFKSLRAVLFAGEVYPPKHLARLVEALPAPRYFNLYGPTETNVCTYYEAPKTFADADPALPIGYPCSGDRARVVDVSGRLAPMGEEGELQIAGGSVMLGYWNLPDRNAAAFSIDSDGAWYRTGDIVREREDGAYIYLGRRDRMVKRRGYRVELGEIEAALNRHPDIAEAAVVVVPGEEDLLIKAFVAWSGGATPSTILLKKHCAQIVPLYMIPDQFAFLDALPKTSTDKIDYQKLKGPF